MANDVTKRERNRDGFSHSTSFARGTRRGLSHLIRACVCACVRVLCVCARAPWSDHAWVVRVGGGRMNGLMHERIARQTDGPAHLCRQSDEQMNK